jgi:hypothetical protein
MVLAGKRVLFNLSELFKNRHTCGLPARTFEGKIYGSEP